MVSVFGEKSPTSHEFRERFGESKPEMTEVIRSTTKRAENLSARFVNSTLMRRLIRSVGRRRTHRLRSGLDSPVDVDLREPVEPRGQVPVQVFEQGHCRWDEDRADDRRVEKDGHAETESHLLEEH